MEFKLDMIGAFRAAALGVVDVGYQALREAQASTECLRREMETAGISDQSMTEELENAIFMVGAEYERQGFINGFRMGVQLMRECTCSVTGGAAV